MKGQGSEPVTDALLRAQAGLGTHGACDNLTSGLSGYTFFCHLTQQLGGPKVQRLPRLRQFIPNLESPEVWFCPQEDPRRRDGAEPTGSGGENPHTPSHLSWDFWVGG